MISQPVGNRPAGQLTEGLGQVPHVVKGLVQLRGLTPRCSSITVTGGEQDQFLETLMFLEASSSTTADGALQKQRS